MLEAVAAHGLGEAFEHVSAGRPQCFDCLTGRAPTKQLELREDEVNRVEIQPLRRQVDGRRSNGHDRLAKACNHVAAEIVGHYVAT